MTDQYSEEVVLEPFIHQCSGRSSLFALDEFTICKPLIAGELEFYEHLPGILKPFTPEFRGVIDVKMIKSKDSYIKYSAELPETYERRHHQVKPIIRRQTSIQKASKSNYCIRLNEEKIEIESRINDEEPDYDDDENLTRISDDEFQDVLFENSNPSKNNDFDKCVNHNPWVLESHQRLFSSEILSDSNDTIKKFILLENLTNDYELPCVMDIKMGKRQFGDNASNTKRLLHAIKVATTTSSSLGLRICGLQVYDVPSRRFKCFDKYYGRTLKNKTFTAMISQFFHNGICLRKDLIGPLIEKLNKLRTRIIKLERFRFYSTSLLIIYDGKHKNDGDSYSKIDVKMIDFANSTYVDMTENNVDNEGYDDGYLFGLDNLINQLNMIS